MFHNALNIYTQLLVGLPNTQEYAFNMKEGKNVWLLASRQRERKGGRRLLTDFISSWKIISWISLFPSTNTSKELHCVCSDQGTNFPLQMFWLYINFISLLIIMISIHPEYFGDTILKFVLLFYVLLILLILLVSLIWFMFHVHVCACTCARVIVPHSAANTVLELVILLPVSSVLRLQM